MKATDALAALHELKWSQAELARRLGVRPNTVSDWMKLGGEGLPVYAASYISLALELKGVRDRAGKALERTKP